MATIRLNCPACGHSIEETRERVEGGRFLCSRCQQVMIPDPSGSSDHSPYPSGSYGVVPYALESGAGHQAAIPGHAPAFSAPTAKSPSSNMPYLDSGSFPKISMAGNTAPSARLQDHNNYQSMTSPPPSFAPSTSSMPYALEPESNYGAPVGHLASPPFDPSSSYQPAGQQVARRTKRQKRIVVVGGAATAKAASMTQALRAEIVPVLETKEGQPSEGSQPRIPLPTHPPFPTHQSFHPPQQSYMNTTNSEQSRPYTPKEQNKIRWPWIVISILLIFLIATGLMMLGVLPNPGFLPSFSNP